MRPIIVVDCERPWIRLLDWWLEQAGHAVTCCGAESETRAALTAEPRSLVVINSAVTAPVIHRHVESARQASPAALIVVLMPRAHRGGDLPTGADICIHAVAEAQTALDEIHRILGDD